MLQQKSLASLIKSFKIEDVDRWFDAPLTLLDSAKLNPPVFLRDKATRVTGAISPFIRRPEFIIKAIREKPESIFDDILRKFNDGADTLVSQSAIRFFHIDLSKNRDGVGICAAHVPYFVDVKFYGKSGKEEIIKKPFFYVDFMGRIEPRLNEDIELADIEHLVYDFRELGYLIGLVTYDGWQSLHSIQNLKQNGIVSANLSIDRTTSRVVIDYDKDCGYSLVSTRGDHMAAYSTLRSAMYEERISVPYHPMWEQEIGQQEEEGGRVRKIPNGTDDLIQAVAGAVFNAESNTYYFADVEKAPAHDLKQSLDDEFAERMEQDLKMREKNAESDSGEDAFYKNLTDRY